MAIDTAADVAFKKADSIKMESLFEEDDLKKLCSEIGNAILQLQLRGGK